MSKKRRNHSAEFKAKAATAIKGGKTLSELAHPFEVYPNQITQWKQQLLEYVSDHNMDTVLPVCLGPLWNKWDQCQWSIYLWLFRIIGVTWVFVSSETASVV